MKNREIILFLCLLAGENGRNGRQVEGHVDYKRSLGLNSCNNYRGMHRILSILDRF